MITAKEFMEMSFRQYSLNAESLIAHSIRVARRFDDEPQISVALLHDIVEDTPIYASEIGALFGYEIGIYVDVVSRKMNEEYFPYIRRVNLFGGIPKMVKIADLLDHLSQEQTLSPSLKLRYLSALEILNG